MKFPTIKMPDSQNVYLLSSFSDRIVQNCMNLSGLFPHKTAAFYSDRCMTHRFESHKMLKPPLKNCDFIWDTIFTLDPSLAS